jgi:hypothetical protein
VTLTATVNRRLEGAQDLSSFTVNAASWDRLVTRSTIFGLAIGTSDEENVPSDTKNVANGLNVRRVWRFAVNYGAV